MTLGICRVGRAAKTHAEDNDEALAVVSFMLAQRETSHDVLQTPRNDTTSTRYTPPRIIHDPENCVTHCRSYVRQNVVVTLGHAPRSGERSYKPINNPG